MSRLDVTFDGRLPAAALAAFAAVVVLSALDLLSDVHGGTALRHVLLEGVVAAVGLAGAAATARVVARALREGRASAQSAARLAEQLRASEAEAARWRGETQALLAGLGEALDRQFERWALSAAEKEVALLLLKGLSHKELAEVRGITEATARQQARSIYKKAGLSGRSDLAAFFLEDLLLPRSRP